MAISTRLIKRRIKSIGNTRKITRAMELVAGSKMRKAVQLTQSSRDYARTAFDVVDEIRKRVDPTTHQMLSGRRKSKTALVIIASSDRGLCGGYNAQVLKKGLEFIRHRSENQIRVVTVGKRAERAIKRAGYNLEASFEAISNAPSFERVRPVSQMIHEEFINGRIDRAFVIFTDYRSAVLQVPLTAQLLPIIPEDELIEARAIVPTDWAENIVFEPGSREILDELLPRLVETRLYQALLEASASEHAARMLAMQNASLNASDMLDGLTFTFNQVRQSGITREISEISAGKAAIE